MDNLPSLRYIRAKKNKWLACASLHSLRHLLKLPPGAFTDPEKSKSYSVFTIKKKSGADRIIENPAENLKALQRSINNYLQAVHYFVKHPASYGFCMNVKNDGFPCNVYTHALQHTGANFLINADLQDFFHAVSWQKAYDVFSASPFIHDKESTVWLTNVCTHAGRLPMGAPTSPVIGNLAATGLDHSLESLAKKSHCTYTRFADDISFSSRLPYPPTLKDEILQSIRDHGFDPNMQKVKEFGKGDVKIITGLVVNEHVRLGGSYWAKTDMLVNQLGALQCLMRKDPSMAVHTQVEDIKERVNGFLAFAQMIGGAENDKIDQVQSKLDNMEEELEIFESLAWDEIPYINMKHHATDH